MLVINRINRGGLHVEAERRSVSVVGALEVPDEKFEDEIWIRIGKSEERSYPVQIVLFCSNELYCTFKILLSNFQELNSKNFRIS